MRLHNSLKSVEIPGNVKSIGDYAFQGNGMEELIINEVLKKLGNKLFTPTASCVYIPDSIKKIGDWAFYANSLKSVEIPGNLKSIGNYAFQENGMRNLLLMRVLKKLGQRLLLQQHR